MSRYVFPYGIRFQENGRLEVFPAAEIFVFGRGELGMRTLFHIDSGATTSIMPASDAEALGLKLPNGNKIIVRGISGEPLSGYRHKIKIQFHGLSIKIPVIFVEDISVPRILGREELFSRFGILFQESRRRVVFLEEKGESRNINKLFN